MKRSRESDRTKNRPFRRKKPKPRKGRRSLLHVGPCRPQAGILRFHKEGYGFLRADIKTYKERIQQDCFVPVQTIRQHSLRQGSYVEGHL